MLIVRASVVLPAAVSCVFAVFATGTRAQESFFDAMEFSGRISFETRYHPSSAAHPGQVSHASGIAVEGTAYVEGDGGGSFTITPFFRYDAGDPERTHADLREAYLLAYGDAGDGEWELRLGIDQVFWGVVESNSLVDIVNQTDLVESPDGKTKLGQPMVHGTLSGDWGVLELFGLTWHRPRTFPGKRGRLRGPVLVDQDLVSYESAAKEWRGDFAARYSGSFGPLDIGLSAFDGTSREPTLMPKLDDEQNIVAFAPRYELIRQYGLDAQVTTGPWLLKLEAIQRKGAKNLLLREEDYSAFTAGGEYTFYSVWDTDTDLTLFAELSRDGRGPRATTVFENDVLLAARIGLNDEYDTEFSTSVLSSLDTDSRILTAEFKRRLTDSWSVQAEAALYSGVDSRDAIAAALRRDSFVSVKLDFSF